MKIIRLALVAPEQMTPQIQSGIQTVNQWLSKVESGLMSQDPLTIDLSSVSGLNSAVEQLNGVLKSNMDTIYVPIKSHSELLIHSLDLCIRKQQNGHLSSGDIQTTLSLIENYRKDLKSVL